MITRLVLRLPWFLSAPVIVAMALLGAVAVNVVAGTYFQRSFRDDADPLAGLALPTATAPVEMRAVAPAPPADAGATSSGTTTQTAAAAPAAAEPAATPAMTASMAAAAPPAPPVPQPAGPAVLREGSFVDGDPGHHGKGRARLIRGADGALTLRFEGFSVTNGPDLFVILSTDPQGSRGSATDDTALNLGRLRATDGNINYSVPPGTDVSPFRSVIIYCRAFKVVFAVATLEEAS